MLFPGPSWSQDIIINALFAPGRGFHWKTCKPAQSVSLVSPVMPRRFIVTREQPGGMNAMNDHSIRCIPPGIFCVPQQDDLITHGAPRTQPQEVDPSGTTWACHMCGMNHLILYTTPFPVNCQEEEKSINASGIFSKQTRGLWKPFKSSFPWTALSVLLKGQLQSLQPSLHLAPSCTCQISQN